MKIIDLPNDLLNVILTYLFEDAFANEERNALLMQQQKKIQVNVPNNTYVREMYSLYYMNRKMAFYLSETKIGTCFFRHITPPFLTKRVVKKKKKIFNFFKKRLLSNYNNNSNNSNDMKKNGMKKFLCTIEQNDIGIKRTTPLFIHFLVKAADEEDKENISKNNCIEYEFDGFNHRLIGVESIFTSIKTGEKINIPAKYFSECSTINFEPTKTRNNLAISVTIDTPDFESLDLRFRLRVPSNTYQMQAWGL